MTVKVGTLSADLDLNGNPFERNLDRAMRTGAEKARRIGDTMSSRVTLPIVAAGAAAVKMGVDFDTSMSRIVGLVGVSAEQVGELRDGVLGLAGETAKSPQELADALFTVTSAGFRGAEAMDVLEQAAKASAAGLGETRTIAEALTGAVNAYGPEVLSAAEATDILVATARAGNFETSQLAGSLGKVTPFAKQAGASLEDVGGATALLTRVNNNAAESMTQITALMRAFVVPTAEAQKILGDLGMEAQDVRDMIGEQGLVATLQMLDERLGGNREQLGRLIGSSEGASAAFQILEADAETLESTFGQVADSAGITEEAFLAWAGTSGAELGKALSDLQVALIEAGGMIAPFVADVAGGLSAVAEAFSSLPGPVQTLVVSFAGLLAAVGPIASIGGRIAANWRTLSSLFDRAAIAAFDLSGKLTLAKTAAVGLAGVAVAGVIHAWRSEMQEAASDAEAFVDVFTRGSVRPVESLDELHDEIMRVGEAAAEMKRRGDEALNPFLKERFREAEAGLIVTRDALLDAEAAAAELQSELGISADEAARMATNEKVMADAMDPATGEIDAQAAAAADAASANEDLADSIKGVTDAIRAQIDPWFAAQDALLKHKDAQDTVKAKQLEVLAAQKELDTAVREHGEGSDEATEAAMDLAAAQAEVNTANRDVVRSALDVSTATAELKMWMEETGSTVDDATAMLDAWVAQGLITKDQAFQVAEELRGTAGAADALDGRNVLMQVGLTGFERVIAQLDAIAARNGTPIIYNASVRARERAAEGRHTGGPMLPGKDYIAGEYGPELIRMDGGAGIGQAIPAGATRSLLDQGGGTTDRSRTVNNNITVNNPPDRPTTKAIRHELDLIELGGM